MEENPTRLRHRWDGHSNTPRPREAIGIVLVGADVRIRKHIAWTFRKETRPWVKMVTMEGLCLNLLRRLHYYSLGQKPVYLKILEFYDALYAVDNEVWVKVLEHRLKNTIADVVVPDIRYMNELEYLREKGFIVVRITTEMLSRPGPSTVRALPGSIGMAQYYSRDFGMAVRADYSIHCSRDDWYKSGKQASLDLLAKLRADRAAGNLTMEHLFSNLSTE